MRRLSALLAILVLAAAACDASGGPGPTVSPSSTAGTPSLFGRGTATIEVQDAVITLDVEIADTPEAQQRGLMFRTSLAEDAGMVFRFPDEQIRRFWMKDTLIPLSIAFYRADGVIVSIRDMPPCASEPCPFYDSTLPASGALEVNQGFFEANGVRPDHVITVTES